MKSILLLLYIVLCYLFILQGYGDHALLLWPLFVVLFFGDIQKNVLIAFIIGFFLDLYSPVFGIFSFIFPATLLLGNILIRTLFSHRSIVSFHAVSGILLCLFSFFEYALFYIASILHMYPAITLPSFHSFVALRFLTIVAQIVILSIAYIFAYRMEKKFMYE